MGMELVKVSGSNSFTQADFCKLFDVLKKSDHVFLFLHMYMCKNRCVYGVLFTLCCSVS